MQKVRPFAFCLGVPILLIMLRASSEAQQVVIDWSNTANPLITSPSEIDRTTPVTIVVRNVNDVLYDYKVDVQVEIGEADDLAKLKDLLTGSTPKGQLPPPSPPGAPPNSCETAVTNTTLHLLDLNKILSTDAALNPTKDNPPKPKSISLAETVGAWIKSVRPLLESLRTDDNDFVTNNCTDPAARKARADIASALSRADPIENKVKNSKHELQVSATLSPGNKYTVTTTETFNNVLTERGSVAVKFAPATNILTLSGGVLFTQVKNPSYVSRPAVAPATGNVLSIEDTGPVRPALVALMNYAPPHFDFGDFGFAVSSGPVITFNGGNNNVSNFGFLLGVSAHLYHRFYLTPAVHFGQFPDTPPGLSDGKPIPSDFGQLTPKKRWTLRFAFGITYKARDFSGLTSSGTPTVSQSSGDSKKPGDSGKPTEKPKTTDSGTPTEKPK